jgi:hypothetical protein
MIALALISMGCAGKQSGDHDDMEMSLAIGGVPDSVDGNVVTIPVTVEGVEIVKANGDTSGDSGHFHVFVDKEPVAVGEAIPKERGVVHSADNPIKVWGLEPGSHEFTVVVGDGTHRRIHEGVEDSVTVDVKGPSVQGTAPATIKSGEDLVVELKAEGVEIVKAAGDTSADSGHFHVLVDPAKPPVAGEVIPAPVEGKIIHTTESSATIEGLKKGEHILWVVLGDGTHKAFKPAVMDKLTVVVG